MSRLRRLETTGKIFFVTCNLASGVPLLAPAERDLFLRVLNVVRRRRRFRLFAYVLMPSHWHALVLPAPGQTISAVMQESKRASALKINKCRDTNGSLWQARFFDEFLRRVRDFHEAVEYIHANPVRDGFTEEPSQWRWSSYSQFVGRQAATLPVDRLDLPLDETRRL